MGLYEILKTSKLGAGAAPDMYTALLAQKISKGGSGGEAELSGVPPLTFRSNGTPLLDYLISGNMEQSGTPTPDNPIIPQGTGERTGNLWDEDYTGININAIYRPLFVGDGEFTLSTNFKPNGGITDIFLLSGNVSSGINSSINGAYEGKNITAQSVNGYITIAYRANARPSSDSLPYYKTMLNTGSTPLPYEPYGYKIPISSNNTTTPVYLGEVQTTRKIKKLVLDGTESWVNAGGNAPYRLPINNIAISSSTSSIEWYCSHYQSLSTDDSWTSYDYCISRTSTTAQSLQFRDVTKGDITAFKQYLAAQYAAGTPVTVWYVLATEETGIVNEPLMKIGDYADTLSMEQAGVQIPTNNGSTTVDVLTAVKPSNVSIKYRV